MQLLIFIKQSHTDIVHYQFFRRKRIESLYFWVLSLLGVNLINTAHNVMPHEKHKVDYLLKRLVYRSSKAIIAHSSYVKNQITKKFKIHAAKIQVIPHGDFDIYLPQNPITKNEAKKKFNLSADDDVLLFLVE